MTISKVYMAQEAVDEYVPLKRGTIEGTVVPAKSPFDFVIGVSQYKVDKGENVEVVVLGESLVQTAGAVDGTKPLVANADGKAMEFDITNDLFKGKADNTSVCAFANPLQIDSAAAYLNCIVCPMMFTISAVAA